MIVLKYNPLHYYQIALSLVKEIGPVTGRKLIAHMGSAGAVFKASRHEIESIPGITPRLVAALTSSEPLKRAEQQLKYLEKYKIRPLFYSDDDYPQRMKNCHDAPLMLYYRGNADLNHRRTLAIVGTRSATSYGRTACEKFVEELKGADVLIVSGLAFGIDSCAHKMALKHKMQTLGVIAHGHDTLYPAQNRNLAAKMLNQGGIITEWGYGVIPEKVMFPRRNRIIAGLSDATLVVEAGKKGGALITADIANSYNRDVFAVPGRIYDNFSVGCNNLIKYNAAALATSARDILRMMNWDIQDEQVRNQQRQIIQTLSETEKKVVDALKFQGPSSMDQMSAELNMASSKLSGILLKLEFYGLVKTLPGNQYQLI
ncbi:MAG: DNA-processing protein DprA [Bacteroidales bacterium]